MELNVIYLNATVLLRRVSILDEELVVDSKLALRHPTQLSLDEDLSNNISFQDGAPNGEEDINVLHSVNKDFVPLVAYPLGPPGYGTRCLDRNLLQLLNVLRRGKS